MHINTKTLHQLMRQHRLRIADVAEMLNRSEHTVSVWRVRNTTRPIPDDTLELLALKAKARTEGNRGQA